MGSLENRGVLVLRVHANGDFPLRTGVFRFQHAERIVEPIFDLTLPERVVNRKRGCAFILLGHDSLPTTGLLAVGKGRLVIERLLGRRRSLALLGLTS
jgi:hypothetical protein